MPNGAKTRHKREHHVSYCLWHLLKSLHKCRTHFWASLGGSAQSSRWSAGTTYTSTRDCVAEGWSWDLWWKNPDYNSYCLNFSCISQTYSLQEKLKKKYLYLQGPSFGHLLFVYFFVLFISKLHYINCEWRVKPGNTRTAKMFKIQFIFLAICVKENNNWVKLRPAD